MDIDREQKQKELVTKIATQKKLSVGIKVVLTLVTICAAIAGVVVALFLAR
ncbi:hypothetical protein KKF61_01135 [Patescibacteria group bacterium]|nr:hypothetical protein [Patescibacteria group bacterium]MBU0964098.1 hypothetical protein [Patescibacteria group bacterium]